MQREVLRNLKSMIKSVIKVISKNIFRKFAKILNPFQKQKVDFLQKIDETSFKMKKDYFLIDSE